MGLAQVDAVLQVDAKNADALRLKKKLTGG